jgi:hypothetical protein
VKVVLVLSKEAKYRLKNAKRSELKAIGDAVSLLAAYQILTIRRASVIDRFIERMGGRR